MGDSTNSWARYSVAAAVEGLIEDGWLGCGKVVGQSDVVGKEVSSKSPE
jgi:hypothetical protein